jgi:polyhydroxyalkanoate synthesis regulator protein
VLAQIIFEQENKEGQNLLPINFLRQLIRFYGDSMQMMVPRYLEVSLESFAREHEKMRQQMAQAFGVNVPSFGPMEDQVRRNMEMFEKAFAMAQSITAVPQPYGAGPLSQSSCGSKSARKSGVSGYPHGRLGTGQTLPQRDKTVARDRKKKIC